MSKTTIVLGAGASAHYGFPTGAALIDDIISYSSFASVRGFFSLSEFSFFDGRRIAKFGSKLSKYDPQSIDSFLTMYKDQPDFLEIGKRLISHIIISKQSSHSITRYNKENWYKSLYDFVFPHGDFVTKLEDDSFRIITFNYDLSLEYFFHSRLETTPTLSKSDAESIFLKFCDKIHHVYGAVYDYKNFTPQTFENNSANRYTYFPQWAQRANHYLFQETSSMHKNIRVVGEERTMTEDTTLNDFRNYLVNSDRIFVLGFGFDRQNISHMHLNKVAGGKHKYIYVTNYNGLDLMNQKIHEVFHVNCYTKISDNSVFRALTEDFSFD